MRWLPSPLDLCECRAGFSRPEPNAIPKHKVLVPTAAVN